MSRDRGVLALVLHSHMPYVEGFGTWPFGEEWLWEAVATVYLPLIELLTELDAPLTLGLTPVLCDQLETLPGPAGDRLTGFLDDTRRAVHDEDAAGLERTREPELAAEVRRAWGDYDSALAAVRAGGRETVPALARLAGRGAVELWTSSASHAVLPLLASDAGVRLQLATGIASHERRFGSFGGGLWLPECAYSPGLERELGRARGAGVLRGHHRGAWQRCAGAARARAHGGRRGGRADRLADRGAGLARPERLSRARGLSRLPPPHRARPAPVEPGRRRLRPGSRRRPGRASTRATSCGRCVQRLDAHAGSRGRPGLLCCALDTELLGHWWYEGQAWLRGVVEQSREQGLELATVSEGVARVEPVPRRLRASTWGTGKDMTTWDSPPVAELAFAARRAELRTVAQAARGPEPKAALARAARELLALQASDWAFQVTRELAADYPLRRVAGHAAAHDAALGALADSGLVPDPALRNLAPDLDLAPLVAP